MPEAKRSAAKAAPTEVSEFNGPVTPDVEFAPDVSVEAAKS